MYSTDDHLFISTMSDLHCVSLQLLRSVAVKIPNFGGDGGNIKKQKVIRSSYFLHCRSSLNINVCSRRRQLHCFSLKNQTKGFSGLTSEIPWESESTWTTMAIYMLNLHIPLGFGGMSIVANLLQQPVLDPQDQALSLLLLQNLELAGTLFLLKSTFKPQYSLQSFFKVGKLSNERNWLLATVSGFAVLVSLVYLTSLLPDIGVEIKDANDIILKEILSSGNLSKLACFLVYCIITPVLEESIYRGFLLRSLAAQIHWSYAVFISSAVFSAAHFSGENFLQLFVIGCILGCSYCWTGNLRSSIAIHSLYNALIVTITFLS